MHKKLFTVFILLFCGLALRAGIEVDGVEINQLTPLPQDKAHGYQNYDFVIINRKPSARDIRFYIYPRHSYGGFTIGSIVKTVTVAPSSTAKVTLYYPHMNLHGADIRITIDGSTYSGNDLNISLSSRTYYMEKVSILITKSVPGNIMKFRNQKLNSYSTEKRFDYQYADIPVSQWNKNWLLYGGFDGIMLSAKDLKRMSNDVRSALEQYAGMGGVLMIYDPDATFRERFENVGFGLKVTCKHPPEKWANSVWRKYMAETRATSGTLLQWKRKTSDAANRDLKVTKDVKVPVRPLFIFMLIFVIIIGPLNYFILYRKKKRIWILWTSPVIAAIFSFIVIFYAFWSEGWHSRVSMNTITFLDENNRTASTIGGIGYYCPIVPGGGLTFSGSTEIQPFKEQEKLRNVGINLTQEQNLRSGWLQSRVPSHFLLRKCESRRERLEIRGRTAEGIEVLNGLGAKLVNLRLVDFDGKCYSALEPVLPGQKIILRKCDITKTSLPVMQQELRNKFKGNWLNYLAPKIISLSKGTYCAKLAESPFMKTGIVPGELMARNTIVGILAKGDVK